MDASNPSTVKSKAGRERLVAIALMCGAVFLFSMLDTSAKFLNSEMSSWQVVWARYTSAFFLSLLLFNPITRPQLMRTRRPFLQVIRGTLLVGSTAFNFLALRYLQLDQAAAIAFSTPFIVTVLAGPMLGEYAGWRRWLAIIVGFAGVLVVIRPSFEGIPAAALLSLGCAFCYAVYSIVTRMLASTDSAETMLFYSNLVGMSVMLPIIPFVWSMPDHWLIVGLMMLTGALGAFGHYLLILAHRRAPASILMPFVYTQLVWIIAMGFIVFGDVPDRWTLLGAAIVIASGLYLLNRERQKRSSAPSPGSALIE